MKTAIHQPHYFPWLGYLDKMAKVDQFILMDTVQLEKGSYMYRNRIIDQYGNVRFLTIPAEKHGFLDKAYCDIAAKSNLIWREEHSAQIKRCYASCEYFGEVWDQLNDYFTHDYRTLCDATVQSVALLRRIFQIETPIILQSTLTLPIEMKKNDLVLGLCKATGTNIYLSGNGAKKYMDTEAFTENGIAVDYQQFSHPIYEQNESHIFIAGLSALDMLFHCGIKKSREVFWDNVKNSGYRS